MQFYSFDFGDPIFRAGELDFSVQVITTINTYGLAQESCRLEEQTDGWRLTCDRLMWAGNQERANGGVVLEIRREGDRYVLSGKAEAGEPLRCFKILLRDLPECTVLNSVGESQFGSYPAGEQTVPPEGLLSRYPGVTAPVWALHREGKPWRTFWCKDPKVRAKRFCAYPQDDGLTVEMIFEEDARNWGESLTTPDWVIDAGDLETALQSHSRFLETECGLQPWDQRQDMPNWTRDLSLVISIHCMHWCGYIFNDYARAREIVDWVCDRIEGRRVLVFLPGWEGRYYWQYGDYRPEPRLGGPEEFALLCDGVRERGAHLMPMFGGNCANAWFDNFAGFGPQSPILSGTRLVNQGNRPDWDISRTGDTGWQAWLNPGAPAWQAELAGQVSELVTRYGFDAVFFDTIHVWDNDPDHAVFEGMEQLVQRLHDAHPDLLITAENWWDRMMGVFPIFHGLPGGPGSWMSRFARRFAHLSQAEPSRGSTGVHELGHRPYHDQTLMLEYWPTITFVENTLDEAQPKVQEVIELAKRYAAEYLS